MRLIDKIYIYYKVKALCIKTWGHYVQAHNIYELNKSYFYKDIDTGYQVNTYTLRIINQEGHSCRVTLSESEFERYFIEVPGACVEDKD